MQEKHQYARDLVDAGHTNAEIREACTREYGSGVSTTKLAEWRSTSADRLEAKEREEKRIAHEAKMARKREIVREVLSEGGSGYAAQQRIREEMGEGCGYELIQEVQAELKHTPSDAITPLELPPEIRADEPEDDPHELVVQDPPCPNGTLTNIKAIQQWMGSINAEALHLSADGKLEVTVRHSFDLGGL